MVQEASLDLTDRPSLMASLPKGGVAAEIGVAQGCFSGLILELCNPRTLYLIDPWEEQSAEVYSPNDPANFVQATHDGNLRQVREKFGADLRVTILRAYSVTAAETFEDETFDWWHLDGNHKQAKQDLEAWWPKLKRGGWGTGHDYTMIRDGSITVKGDVDSFVAEHGLELFVTRGDTDIYEKNYPTWAIQKP